VGATSPWSSPVGTSYPPANPYYQSNPPPYQPPRTSGLAIAAFVVSILWLWGVGSILAIIFALNARSKIRQSKIPVSGDGFAIAGLVIGIVGLIGSVFFWVSAVFFIHTVAQIQENGIVPTIQPTTFLSLGEPSPAYAGLAGGTITVNWIVVGADSQDPSMPTPPLGQAFTDISVRECAGAHGTTLPDGPSSQNFQLALQDGGFSHLIAFPDFVSTPVFDQNNVQTMRPHQCIDGLVAFAQDNQPVAAVEFVSGRGIFRWAVLPGEQNGER
jgi:hypothetical protein